MDTAPAAVAVKPTPSAFLSPKLIAIVAGAVVIVGAAIAVPTALVFTGASDGDPSPPPSPGRPPPYLPSSSTETVLLTLTASGRAIDYPNTLSLQQRVADAAGVDRSLVTISVVDGAAASVIIAATIGVPASTTAAAVAASLRSTVGTAAAASEALDIEVSSEQEPTITVAADLAYRVLSTASGPGTVYSAMALSGDAADGDLERMLYYVVSDMSARWGYHHLTQGECCNHGDSSCCPLSQALPVLLFYHSGQAPNAKLAFNAELAATLPSGYPTNVTQGFSTVDGNGKVSFMRVMYDEVSPMHRLSVIFHEYLHVVQINKCGNASSDSPGWSLWLREGAAMATENLYLDYYFVSQNDDGSDTTGVAHEYYSDRLFTNNAWGAVKWTINDYLAGSWSMSSALESYAGATGNNHAEGAAFVYLCSRTSYKYAMVDFINSGDCDMTRHGNSKDASFAAVFGTGSSYATGWTGLADFYADFNGWLATNPDPATLKPTAAQINEVFSHTTICSDLCATASNGVCDASCLHGSDCSDCGSAPKPAAFPVTLRAHYDPGAHGRR